MHMGAHPSASSSMQRTLGVIVPASDDVAAFIRIDVRYDGSQQIKVVFVSSEQTDC